MWWSWICVVALLLGIILFFLFYSTGFVPSSLSRLRPNQMPRYVTVVSSFVRLLRRLDSNPRAVSWECRRADLMTSWNNSLTHSRLLHSFLPSQSSKERNKKKYPNLVPVPLLLPCNTNPSQIVLRLVRPSVNAVTVLSRPVANPCQSYSPPTPSSRSSLPLLLLCLPFSGSVF